MGGYLRQSALVMAVLACGASGAAIAQSTGAASPEPSSQQADAPNPQAGTVEPSQAPGGVASPDGGIADIVVTAQRRSENLQNVPIAITALSSETLAASGINDIQSLQISTPSLSYAQAAGYSLPRIRGVGTGANGPGVENSVAMYVDGVYVSSTSAGTLAFNNIAQIAVLKGPQGTLFGRNATGGVIQITTLDPGQTPTVTATAGYGNYDTVEAKFYASTPLTGTLAFDAALYYKDQNKGFGYNRFLDTDVGQGTDVSFRSKVKWDPTDTTTLRVVGDFSRSNGRRFFNRVFPGALGISGVPTPGDEWDTYNTFSPRQRITQRGVSAQVDQALGALTLVSITAWRRSLYDVRFDADAQPAPITDVNIRQRERQFSQEVQLLSAKDGPFTWVMGGYYFRYTGFYEPQRVLSRAAPYLAPPTRITTTGDFGTKSLAAFGQATYALAADTNLTAGLRYTTEDRDANITKAIVLPNGVALPPGRGVGESNFKKLTWRGSIDHRFSPGLLAYASVNRGFKSGLYDALAVPLVLLKPEVLDAYEVGVKSDLFDRRVRLNGALFHYNYKQIQIARFVNGTLVLENGSGAKIDGLDVDATWQATPNLTFTAGLSILDDRFTSYPTAPKTTPLAAGGIAVATADAKGNKLPSTPDWTLNLTANYVIPTAVGTFELNGTYLHNDGYYQGPENRLRQKPFDLINSSLSWTSTSGTYRASLWAKNLGDEFYATQLTSQSTADALLAGDRRTYGFTLGFKY